MGLLTGIIGSMFPSMEPYLNKTNTMMAQPDPQTQYDSSKALAEQIAQIAAGQNVNPQPTVPSDIAYDYFGVKGPYKPSVFKQIGNTALNSIPLWKRFSATKKLEE